MKPHKHAEVLRAIADGVPLEEFEVWHVGCSPDGYELFHRAGDIVRSPESWEVRRKPQYIMVNGFKVPKPLDVMPGDEFVFAPYFVSRALYTSLRGDDAVLAIEHKVAHGNADAAIAHAKAMLGIDPEAE